jgi:hypothetical protein
VTAPRDGGGAPDDGATVPSSSPGVRWRLRQVAVLVEDEEPVSAAMASAFGLSVAYRDPHLATYGMRNAILPVGDAFLEVAASADPETPAARYLRRHGAGGYVVILQTDDLAAAEARLEQVGVGVARRIEQPDVTELHLRHRDVGGVLLSLDEARPADSWAFAGPDWRSSVRTERVTGFAGIDIACADPVALGHRWSEVLGCPLSAGGSVPRIALEGSDIRFVPAHSGAPDRLTRIRLRPAPDVPLPDDVSVGASALGAGPANDPVARLGE